MWTTAVEVSRPRMLREIIFYNKPEDAARMPNKDARLYGSIILSGCSFQRYAVPLQAGRKILENGFGFLKLRKVVQPMHKEM